MKTKGHNYSILSQKEIDNLILLNNEGCRFIVPYGMYIAIKDNPCITYIIESWDHNLENKVCTYYDDIRFASLEQRNILIRFPSSNSYAYYNLTTIDKYFKLRAFS